MIKSIHDLGNCTDMAQLKAQNDNYRAEIAGYCKVNPLCAAIILKMGTDENFLHFISLIVARSTLTARIKELEDEAND